MPAFLDDRPCPACGGRHVLGLPDHHDIYRHRDFEYV